SDRLSDITGTDRTEQLAFIARLGSQANRGAIQLLATGLSSSQLLCSLSVQLGTTGFNGGQIVLGRRQCFTLRDQEVTAITGAHINNGTQIAQVFDFLEQNNLHDLSPRTQLSWLSENGSRAR